MLSQTVVDLADIHAAVTPPDTVLIGPARLREVSAQFAEQATGEMSWFNVCLSMFEPQALFDVLLRPAVENPRVTSIQFVLDEGERQRWETAVLPKLARCSGAEKVLEPHWSSLHEPVSVIFANAGAGGVEALLSFWGEPFMGQTSGQNVPRYIFHVQRHSELIGRLRELERSYRLTPA